MAAASSSAGVSSPVVVPVLQDAARRFVISGFSSLSSHSISIISSHCGLSVPHYRRRLLHSSCARNLFSRNYNESGKSRVTHHHLQDSDTAREFVSSPELVAVEYAELNLRHEMPDFLRQEVGHVRIRQHVNPLSSSFSVPAEVPDWNSAFRNSALPLVVDIGCGSGRFLLWLAKRNSSSKNYLGMEIREKLVKRANFWVKELSLLNVHFLYANATVSFKQLISSYPGPLVLVSILCPDPHFKKRHKKRRVVQKPLVENIVNGLTSRGQVFVQSDVLEVAVDMRNQFDSVSEALGHIDEIDPTVQCDPDGWLLNNPMGIRTEREIHAELEGAKIYRRLYQKGP